MNSATTIPDLSNPFPGLRCFLSEEDYLFFGRHEQIEDLLRRLRTNRLVAVVGTSGSGKSSLVRAGLLPAVLGGGMAQAGSAWEIAVMRPGGSPMAHLARALCEAGLYDADAEDALFHLQATLSRSRNGLVESVRQSRAAAGSKLLLVVDQFEELFRFNRASATSQEEAIAFVNLLLHATQQADQNVYVVLTMRSDFLGECSQYLGLADAVNDGEFLIPRMTRDQIQQAIEGPIRVRGAAIAPRLLFRLLNDVQDNQDQLPVLQHALLRTWDLWQQQRMKDEGGRMNRKRSGSESSFILPPSCLGSPLDLEHYEATGGMHEALSRHADEIFASFPSDPHRTAAARLFKALTERGPDGRGIRRPTRLGQLVAIAAVAEPIVHGVIEAYRAPGVTFLMPPVPSRLDDTAVIDISHESLMRVWRRLRGWVEEEAQSARIYRRLQESAMLHGEKRAGLYHDPDLQIALSWCEASAPNSAWAGQYGGGFDEAMAFLDTSREAADREETEREAARQHELEQARQLAETQVRVARLFQRFAGGLAVALCLAVALMIWALKLRQEAIRQEAAANQQRQVAQEKEQSERDARHEAELSRQAESLQRKNAESSRSRALAALKEADNQREIARQQTEVTQQNLYYAQMHLAQQAWREHRGLFHMRELLTNWLPKGLSPDRRGWEWFYLNSLPYQNLRTFTESGTSGRSCTVAWHVASNRLAEGTADGLIRIWDVDREQTTLTLRAPAPPIPWWGGRWLAWGPDGDKLAAGCNDGTVHVWETRWGRELGVFRGHKSLITSVAYSSDGMRLAAWATDGTIKIWDVNSGRLTGDVAHPGDVSAGAWSPDDKLLAAGHGDGTVTISETRVGGKVVTLRGHASVISHLAWSPDGTRLASTSWDFTARIWEVASEKMVLAPLRHSHAIVSIAWEPNGQRLATGSIDETVKIWNATTGREDLTLRGHVDAVRSLAWGPEGRLASGSEKGSLRIWKSIRDQESSVLPGHVGWATSVSWSPDGKRLASGGDDGKIRIWDPATRAEVISIKGHDERRIIGTIGNWMSELIRSLAWSPDGTQLASAGLDGAAKVWEVASGREVFALPADRGAVWSVAWSPDGTRLAAGSEDGTIRVVQGLNHTPKVHTLKAHQSRARGLAWSPQGDRLASGGADGLVKLWDPIRGTELARMQGHQTARFQPPYVAWSPDGKRLASCGADRLVIAWDAETGRKLSTMRGHNDWVDAVVWSPDGTRLASAGLDNSVRVWDPRSGEETLALRGQSGMFHDVAWHPDGAQLAAASSDGQIWIWDATRGFERDTTPRALPFIDRSVASGTGCGEDLRWYAESYIRAGKPREALATVKADRSGLRELLAQLPAQERKPLTQLWADVAKAAKPANNAERLAFAQIASDLKQFAFATRLWAEALASDPKLGADRQTEARYNAARDAALAAAGQGKDESPLDDAAKAKLRGQALDWLKAELRDLSKA